MSKYTYAGSELDLFRDVQNWKAYWSSQARPFVIGDVLEVGAGIGANTRFIDSQHAAQWVCLEPDSELLKQLSSNLAQQDTKRYEMVCGTLPRMGGRLFDTIVYIDVLEHIEQDREELEAAAAHLRKGGKLIVLSPAHQRLFSPFDRAIGHFRRYNRAMIKQISPRDLQIERIRYLDCVGLTASAANLLFLRQNMPTKDQLRIWDKWMIPVSRILDRLLYYSFGKSILAIWYKP